MPGRLHREPGRLHREPGHLHREQGHPHQEPDHLLLQGEREGMGLQLRKRWWKELAEKPWQAGLGRWVDR